MGTNEKAAHAWQGDGAAAVQTPDHSVTVTGSPASAGGRAGAESPASAAIGPASVTPMQNPGPVSPGLEIEGKGSVRGFEADNLSIDWLSITAPEPVWLQSVRGHLSGIEGGPSVPCKAQQGFRQAERWPSGCKVMWGHRSGRAWLLVPGAACAILGGANVWQLGQVGLWGGTCKRIDIRRDLHGHGITLVDDLVAGCDRGELCHVRQYGPMPIRGTDGGLIGNGVYLGSKFSARFIRAYDKGLEQGTNAAGEWVRYEAQLQDDYAHEAALAIFTADAEAWPTVAFKRLIGVADFRVGAKPGYRLEQFPRPRFWCDFVGDAEAVRARMEPQDVDVDQWAAAVRQQYGGMIVAAAERAGITVGEAATRILGGSYVSPGTRQNPVLPKLVSFLRDCDNS